MGKRGKNQKKSPQILKKTKLHNNKDVNDMEDEIDVFHKKRDIIPLDINDDNVDSDEDDEELPVFDYEGIDGDEDDDEDEDKDDDEYDDDDDDDEDDSNLTGFAAKLARQQKFMREKTGGVDDEVDDDAEEDEKIPKVWSSKKGIHYGGENTDYESQSSGEDTPAEEEEEVIKMQKERAESLRAEDFGLQGDEQDDSDQEPTLEEMMVKGKTKSKSSGNKEAEVDAALMFEEVKKDLNALSRDEQMDVVYSSAPELVGLLAELNDATKQLETHVNPLLSKVRKGENAKKEGLHYLEVKQLLLLAYCQAITFYLLLKSEGQPIRDHPVIARLVEIKNLLEKMKELDVHIPDNLEDVLVQTSHIASAQKPVVKGHELSSDLFAKLDELTGSSIEKQKPSKLREAAEPVQKQSVEVNEKRLRMIKDQPMSSESVQMLQYRAGLQKQLKQRADSVVPKTNNSKNMKLKKIPGKLETTDDYDDDVMALEGATRGSRRASTLSSKLSQIVPAKGNRLKGVSGDDDLPERDDLGERRWKHELRVLARAGIKSKDNDDAELDNEPESLGGKTGNGADAGDSDEDNNEFADFYNLVKKQKEAKLKLKAAKFSRNPQDQYELEITADGKRHISMQMEKNRGLTRDRKKQIKNPRKKYKLQHKKAVNSRKGQVREVKRPKLSYEGELTGINPRISRSRRLG
ncbi:something about silencing protein 10-like isoform X2 [Chenopodium quinoa]|uniref:something about silencing protein 10-like isoform X2 n=1 Tax=Chenopodium quinoa TaxID=63459 RepID=UPI000B78DF56|nr:something about silencing protein 10-like isoform X2 [Chenopodium quinoa]